MDIDRNAIGIIRAVFRNALMQSEKSNPEQSMQLVTSHIRGILRDSSETTLSKVTSVAKIYLKGLLSTLRVNV